MSLVPINAGGWDPNEVLTSAQMNALQVELLKAVDGQGGGSYALSAPLIFSGADFQFAGTARVLGGGFLHVNASGVLDILTGGSLNVIGASTVSGTLVLSGTGSVSGTLNVPSGALQILSTGKQYVTTFGELVVLNAGELTIMSTGVFTMDGDMELSGDCALTGEVEVPTGGLISLIGGKIIGSTGAEIQVLNPGDLTINDGAVAFRLAMVPTFVGSSWLAENTGTWLIAHVSPSTYINFPLSLRPGDRLDTLTMTINGGVGGTHPSIPTDVPVIELMKVGSNGVHTVVQTMPDTTAVLSTYNQAHIVTMSGGLLPYVMTSDPHYVRVLSEGLSGGIDNRTRLCSIGGTMKARGFRSATEVYS